MDADLPTVMGRLAVSKLNVNDLQDGDVLVVRSAQPQEVNDQIALSIQSEINRLGGEAMLKKKVTILMLHWDSDFSILTPSQKASLRRLLG